MLGFGPSVRYSRVWSQHLVIFMHTSPSCPLQLGRGTMALTKAGGKMKDPSAINEVVAQEYKINVYWQIHLWSRRQSSTPPQGLKEIWRFVMKGMETPDTSVNTRVYSAARAKGIRNVPHGRPAPLSRKGNEGEDSPHSSVLWSSTFLLTLWKIYSQYEWRLTTNYQRTF